MSVTILEKKYGIGATRMLDLSNNYLISIPDEVFSLVNLEELYIQNAGLITPFSLKIRTVLK